MKISDPTLITQYLNGALGVETRFFECSERTFFNYTAGGLYQHQTALGYNLAGQMGQGEYSATSDGTTITVTCVNTSQRRVNGVIKTYNLTSVLTANAGTYTLKTTSDELKDLFLAIMPQVKKTATYQVAVGLTGKPNPTDEEVAAVLCVANYTVVDDKPDVLPEDVKAMISFDPKTGKVTSSFSIKGVETEALRYLFWVNPTYPLNGQPMNQLGGTGDTVEGTKEFTVDNDFNNRTINTVIIPNKSFVIRGQFTYPCAQDKTAFVEASISCQLTKEPFNFFVV
jgi:hypothetical protein